MLTTCTECGTRFRLTAAQLRQADGQVRCSRCDAVFDAFVHLHGDDGTPWSVPVTDTLANDTPDLLELPSDEQLESSLLGDTDDLTPAPGARQEPRMDDLFAALESDAVADAPMADEDQAEPRETDQATPEVSATSAASPDETATELPPHEHQLARSGHRRHRKLWALGCLLLLLLLAVQIIHAHRARLAHSAVLGPGLVRLYAWLGQPLPTARVLAAWQVSDTNVTSDPEAAGALSITGSLVNTANFAQAWPLMRVELTDRYGDVLQRRDFEPAQYMPADEAAKLPAANTATHFRLDVVDPGPDAVGFKLTPCYDFPNGRVCDSNGINNQD